MVKNHKIFASAAMLILVIFIFIMLICRKTPEATKNDRHILIGLSLDSLVVERWEKDRNLFMAKAKELGANVIVQNANNDTDEQISEIKYLIDKKVDVLVVIPHDSNSLSAEIKSAENKGIKVVAYDRLANNSGVDLYVSCDNEKVGEHMAKAMVKKQPSGNYIIINGDKGDNNSILYNKGIYKVLKPYIQYGKIKIIGETWSYEWREEDAYNVVEKALTAHKKINGIIAGDDRLAEAAIQALSERKLAGKVPVVAQDAELAACQRIVEGYQYMTIYKPIKTMAQTAAEMSVKLAKGEKISTNKQIFDGKSYVPFQCENIQDVYKYNMIDTVVKDNFHRIDEIYRNTPESQWPKKR